MLSTSQRDQLAKRRNVEHVLFAIGLTKGDVASAMNIDEGSVQNDYRHLGGDVMFPLPKFASVSERRDHAYRIALERYAQIHLLEKEKRDDMANDLYPALGRHLDITRLRGIADGIAEFVGLMLYSVESPKWIGYRRLLSAVFGERYKPPSGRAILQMYFEQILLDRNSKESHLPNNLPTRDSFPKEMAEWARWEFARQFTPTLGETAAEIINSILATLSPKSEKVIRLRFGLGCDDPKTDIGSNPWTLEQIGNHLDVMLERVRQIESKALRQLRQPERACILRRWTISTEELLMNWLNRNVAPDEPEPVIVTPAPLAITETSELEAVLNKSIEELELSSR